jgi:LuxR family maltose regulon positive regulatory protein
MAATTAPRAAARVPGDVHAPAVPRLVSGLVERPRLFALLDRGALGPVTVLVAPAGSGKTMLLSSWLRSTKPAGAVAWVGVERDEADATRFWGMVMDALRGSGALPADDPLATLTPAPQGGQEEFLQRLIEGVGRLPGTVFLVLDDLHHLQSQEGLRGLEELLARSPEPLRTVILTRRDPPLGLHRLRLAGELMEIRGADLHFTGEEAEALMAAAGLAVADEDLARLHRRTEGWAAGLRLAALSLARHDAPARFVAEFSGSERTVADYLLGEVLASRPPEIRELLLRTSILERVNGPLADLLTGRKDGHRLLHELEEDNALVVAVDVGRTWFRYHHLLGDLLRFELRRQAPEEVAGLHRLAAVWHAEHDHPVEAIRHAVQGADWALAAELLGRHWVHLVLDGEEATLGALLAALPSGLAEEDAELAAIAAADRLSQSRWTEADELLATAERALGAVPEPRRRRAETALATVQLLRARRLGDLGSVIAGAAPLLDRADGDGGPAGDELRALALLNLGIAESWTWTHGAGAPQMLADAEAHLEQALALGRRSGRPYLEVGCLSSLGGIANLTHRIDLAEERLRQSIAVADRVGWSTHPFIGVACITLAAVVIDRGRFAEGERWLERAVPILAHAPEPAATVGVHHARGMLAMMRGHFADALTEFRAGEQVARRLRAPHFLTAIECQWQLRALLRLGDDGPVRVALDARDGGAQWCSLDARLRLLDDDAEGAVAAVAPVLAGTAFVPHVNIRIEALLLAGLAHTRLGDAASAERAVEQALALAEPHGHVWIVLTIPGVRDLLAAHPRHRTAHAAHLQVLLDQLAGVEPARAAAEGLAEPLRERELAVLRFLPTNLSAGEIGAELFLSVHTVKTHMRKLYAKLDVHTRAEAVQRGRALGLLAPPRRLA